MPHPIWVESKNIIAFILLVIAGVIGAIDLFQTGFKSLIGWALVAISIGVIVQEAATHASHGVTF